MPTRRFRLRALVIAVVTLGCTQAVLTPTILPRDAMPRAGGKDEVLKLHMRSGSLYQLQNWQVRDQENVVVGSGTYFDMYRSGTDVPAARVPIDSIALVETNSQGQTFTLGLQGVGALTTLGAMMSVACLSDPKSCFGSCPTFYMEGQDSARVRAEGFSASVARVLESRDVDALGTHESGSRDLAIHMKNEAWETHMVRRVSLLAASVGRGERVFANGDSLFYRVAELMSPSACDAADGSCLHDVQAADGVERTSRVDSTDLAAREVIELSFSRTPSDPGLVLSARNSLVTTYLFYQTLAYTGSRYGDMLSAMEQGTRAGAQSQFGMASRLGGIEVQVRADSGTWTTVGVFGEPGPIATDTKVIPLPIRNAGDRPLHVRLRMAKGSWRVDWAALASLHGTVQPLRLAPVAVSSKGTRDSIALHSLRGDEGTRRLVSLPGADYRMQFRLPDSTSRYELFLESEGYYYEWMRREWLPEENAMLAAAAIADPAGSLRRLAPAYHARERMMDSLFFHSRFTQGGTNATR